MTAELCWTLRNLNRFIKCRFIGYISHIKWVCWKCWIILADNNSQRKGNLYPPSILLFSFGELLIILLELSEELQGHFVAEEIYFWLGVGFSLVFRLHVRIINCRKNYGSGLKHINYFLECRKKKRSMKSTQRCQISETNMPCILERE